MMKKFKTQAILGAYTGIVPPLGFGVVHEVLDRLFPGIMLIGCALVGKSGVTRRELDRNLPQLATYVAKNGNPNEENFEQWFAQADVDLGQELALGEPADNQDALAREAFADGFCGEDS